MIKCYSELNPNTGRGACPTNVVWVNPRSVTLLKEVDGSYEGMQTQVWVADHVLYSKVSVSVLVWMVQKAVHG